MKAVVDPEPKAIVRVDVPNAKETEGSSTTPLLLFCPLPLSTANFPGAVDLSEAHPRPLV